MLSNSERVGKRIRAARKASGMTQSKLGEVVGVSTRTVGGWEKGEASPQPLNLIALYEALPTLERHHLDASASWPEDLERFVNRILGPSLANLPEDERRAAYSTITQTLTQMK